MVKLAAGFNRLFTATLVSNLADGMTQLALPLLAASVTRDPALVGGLTAALRLPWLLFALPSGALVDRADRRLALAQANFYRAAVIGGLAAVTAGGSVRIWLLYVAAFMLGMGETVSDNAAQALLPAVVPVEQLDVANSRLQGAMLVTDAFLGAPLAGVLFAVEPWLPFAGGAVAFLAAAIAILALHGSFRAPGADAAPARRRLRYEIGDGLRWLAADPVVRPMVVIAGIGGLINSALTGILVLLALEELGLDQRAYGLFITSAAVGGVIGSATAPRVATKLGRTLALGVAQVVAGVGYLGLGLAPHWAVAAIAFAAGAWGILLWNVVSMSVRQTLIPAALIGRVMGAWRTVVWGCMPLGALLGGFAGRTWGLRTPFVVGAILQVAMVVPTLRMRIEPAETPAAAALTK